MGGKGKKQTIGYKYFLGMHLALSHGPIDKLLRILVDGRLAWKGISTGGQITIDKPDIFGGEEREGGVSGTLDVEMGGPTQLQNDYLVSQLGNFIPAYRGIFGIVFRKFYLGNNPYLKNWSFRASRIHVRQRGVAQWYDEKAEVPALCASAGEAIIRLEFTGLPQTNIYSGEQVVDPSNGFIIDYGVTLGSNTNINTIPESEIDTTSRSRFNVITPSQKIDFYWREAFAPLPETELSLLTQFGSGDIPNPPVRGRLLIKQPGEDEFTVLFPKPVSEIRNPGAPSAYDGEADENGWFRFRALSPQRRYFDIPDGGSDNVGDMNPTHIIRECLTEPDWGMGYTDGDIDDVSFTTAADTLHSEGLGMSLIWDRQIKIEEFVEQVRRHIDAAIYVSRVTGKFTIKLIRNDYTPSELLLLDESNIIKIDNPNRVSFGELVNSVTVNYWNSTTGKDASLTVTDTALVRQQGAVINIPVQYPGFTNSCVAKIVGQRDLRALSIPGLKCTILADSSARNLNPGDAFRLSWGQWGVDELVMRVVNISYGTGRNNSVRIECTQDVYDTNTVSSLIVVQPGEWQDPSRPPLPLTRQLAFEAPYYELVRALGQSEIDSSLVSKTDIGFVAAAAARPLAAINANMWSDIGSGYEKVDVLDFAPYATLNAPISAIQTLIPYNLSDDLDLVELGEIAQIGEEIVRVDAIDTVAKTITVGRGALDTVPRSHPMGETVFFWQEAVASDPTEYVDGETVNVKLTPVSGAGAVALSQASALPVTIVSRAIRPYAPGDLRINGDSYLEDNYEGELTFTWTHRDRVQQTGGVVIDHTAASIGPEAGTLYRVRGYIDDTLVHTEDDISGTSATWTPASEGIARVEVDSKRDDFYSYQAATHEFYYTSSDVRLDQEGVERMTQDGTLRLMEE